MADALPSAASAAHLTDALRRCGALGSGSVRDVAVKDARNTILSRIIRLSLTYDGAADGAPSALFLKTGHPDRASPTWNAGRAEVAFYSQVASASPAGLFPRCFEAHWEAETDAWHLLLEDLTDSHIGATQWPLPPSFEQCQTVIRVWARFHAAWWDDPRLGDTIGEWGDVDGTNAYLKRLADELTRFFDRLGDRLPSARRDIYERLVDAGPRLLARYLSRRNLTIVHGDAHFWNCFLPRDGGGDVRIFDWDSWYIDAASSDLAYMMAMHWYPDRRQAFERTLLDTYHATLAAQGIGFDRAALDDDYRVSVLWLITRPVWQAANNIPPVIWWNNLERIMLAVEDLGCAELLKP